MAAKASWHWNYVTVTLCISFCLSLWYSCCIRITDGLAVIIIIIIKGIYIAQVRQGHKCSCIVGRRSGPYVAARMFVIIGATTAEKLAWTSRGVDADFLPFPPPSLPRLPLLPHPCFIHSLSYSSSLLTLSSARRSGEHCKLPTVPSEKMAAGCRSWRGPNTLGSRGLQSWSGHVPLVP